MNAHKDKGTRFESAIVRYLRDVLDDKNISRMALHGNADEGDIEGVKFLGCDLVLECKDTRTLNLTEHLREAQAEAINHREAGHPTLCGVLVQHAPGIGIASHAGDQWVVMRLEDFTRMIKLANKQNQKLQETGKNHD